MAEITLNNGIKALVDDEDVERLSGYRWCWMKPARSTSAYAMTTSTSGKGPLYMHRLILNAPDGVWVDHKNDNGLDNRKENLRLATRSLNEANKRYPKGASGHRGVYQMYRRWVARIEVHGRCHYLGIYVDVEDAARAYDRAARLHFGEFACLNFPAEGERAA